MHGGGVALEGQHEAEARSARDVALHGDVAAHRLDDALADGEAEPRAAAAARAVDLAEGLEQRGDRIGRDADAGVADLEGDACPGAAGRHRREAQRDAAALGELDRVADEVQQHLLQALGVADHPLGEIVFQLEVERELLALRIGPEQGHHRGGDLVQRHRRGRQAQLAGFDLRVVEHVVEDGHQRLAGRGRRAHELALRGVESRSGAAARARRARRSSACGSRGSSWPGTAISRRWRTRRTPWRAAGTRWRRPLPGRARSRSRRSRRTCARPGRW